MMRWLCSRLYGRSRSSEPTKPSPQATKTAQSSGKLQEEECRMATGYRSQADTFCYCCCCFCSTYLIIRPTFVLSSRFLWLLAWSCDDDVGWSSCIVDCSVGRVRTWFAGWRIIITRQHHIINMQLLLESPPLVIIKLFDQSPFNQAANYTNCRVFYYRFEKIMRLSTRWEPI